MPMFKLEARLKRQAMFDLLFRSLTRLSAFGVLALLAAIIFSLVVGSMPAIEKFGFGFLVSSEWDPVNDEFGALIPIVGTLITSGIALLIAIPVSFRHRHLSDRTLASHLASPFGYRHRVARRHPQHHLWYVGAIHLRATVRRLRRTLAQSST